MTQEIPRVQKFRRVKEGPKAMVLLLLMRKRLSPHLLRVTSHYPSGIEEEEPNWGDEESDPGVEHEADEAENVETEEPPRKGIGFLSTPSTKPVKTDIVHSKSV